MNVIFIELPKQDPDGESARDSVPYAAARLAAQAEARGALARADWAFLDQDTSDHGGDAAVCSAVLSAQPELAVFCLRSWNLDRSIWVAKRIRALLPATHLAAFGPEAADSSGLLREQAFDAIIEGEAEDAFLDLLEDAANRSLKPRYTSAAPANFAALPDPYLAGVLAPAPGKPVYFEARRGSGRACPLRYEPWPQGLVREAPKDHAPRLLRLASDKGASGFRIRGGAYPQGPDAASALKALAAANEGGVPVYAELDPSAIGDDEAFLWSDAALAEARAPLVSVNPASLSALGLSLDRDAFEAGIHALWTQGLHVKPALILGLPHDAYENVIDSFDYLGMAGMGQDTELWPLAVKPGTLIRASTHDYGIREFLERPPYWTVETEWMEEDDFLDAVADFEESFDVALAAPVKPCFKPSRGGFTSFADLRTDSGLDALVMSPEKLASSVTLLLSADDPDQAARVARAARSLKRENPYTLWQLVLVSDAGLPPDAVLSRLADAFSQPEHYFELERLYSLDPQPTFQTRLFFCTRSEPLALRALKELPRLETLYLLGQALPGPKLLEAFPFLAFDRDATPFELLYDVMSAYRDFPDLLVEAPRELFGP